MTDSVYVVACRLQTAIERSVRAANPLLRMIQFSCWFEGMDSAAENWIESIQRFSSNIATNWCLAESSLVSHRDESVYFTLEVIVHCWYVYLKYIPY